MKRLGVGERFVEEYTKQKMGVRSLTEALKVKDGDLQHSEDHRQELRGFLAEAEEALKELAATFGNPAMTHAQMIARLQFLNSFENSAVKYEEWKEVQDENERLAEALKGAEEIITAVRSLIIPFSDEAAAIEAWLAARKESK